LSRWAHIRSKDDLIAFTNGRQAGLRTASDAVDQLLERRPRGARRRGRPNEGRIDMEIAALRRELEETRDLMERLRTLNAFARYERTESDRLN
jgi:hypothetical protein